MHKCSTTKIIEDLIVATRGCASDVRGQYVLRQALHGLVRQAKAEQLLEIRLNVARLTGLDGMALKRRQTKSILKRIERGCDSRQQQFEFERGDKPG